MRLWPLAGANVLDVSTGVSGPLCGKLLADAGASVTKVELPGGDESRGLEPAPAWFEFLNLGKRLRSLDPGTADGRSALEELLAASDLYLTSSTHAGAASWGLDCPSVLERYPDLVSVCVTPFGQAGPYSSYAADDLVLSALSGLADATPGFPDRQEREDDPPVQSLAPLAEMAGGISAACAAFGPLVSRLRRGHGPRHVEVAALEAAVSMMAFEWGTTAYGGGVRGRRPRHEFPEPNCYLPCLDGDVVIVAFREDHWRALVDLMGNPGWASDLEFRDAAARSEHRGVLHERLRVWAATQRGLDILRAAQARGLPCAPCLELSNAIASDHVRTVGSVRPVGSRLFPADPVVIDGARRSARSAACFHVNMLTRSERGDGSVAPAAPLAGVRVLDLSHIVAGPYAGQLLAALGAEVILIESARYPVSRSFGPFVGEPRHDASMMFNQINRGKKSVQIDLTTAGGRRLLHALVAASDVVLENLSRQAAVRLGLTYEELAGEREDLVLCSISGFGRSGPWGDYVALHSGVILLSGLASVTRDETGRPRLPGSIYPDLLAGAYAALAIQQALAARDQTGVGCHVEVSMLDVLLTCMGGLVPAAASGSRFGSHPGRFLRTAEPGGFLAVSGDSRAAPPAKIARQTRREAMATLQEAGIKAGAVLDMSEVMADPHLARRGFVLADDHPVAGPRPVPAVPWVYDGARPTLRHAPRLGDRTEKVLAELAGLSHEEEEALRAEGVLT